MSKNTIHSSKNMQLKFSNTFINVTSWLKKKINALQFSKKKSQRCKNEKNSLATHEIIAMRTFVIIKKKNLTMMQCFSRCFFLCISKTQYVTNEFILFVQCSSFFIENYSLCYFNFHYIFASMCVLEFFNCMRFDDWWLNFENFENRKFKFKYEVKLNVILN